MKLAQIINFLESEYRITIPHPKEADEQDWVEIQQYNDINRYTQFPSVYFLFQPPVISYCFNFKDTSNEARPPRSRLFIPKKVADEIFCSK